MSNNKKFNLSNVNFSNLTFGVDLMDVFVKYATLYPKNGKALFNKYVDFICKQKPDLGRKEARCIAATNIGYLAGNYNDEATVALLYNTYKAIAHPIYGRVK